MLLKIGALMGRDGNLSNSTVLLMYRLKDARNGIA